MQRLNRDLAEQVRSAYGDQALCLHPRLRGAVGWIDLAARAVASAFRLRGRSPRIHLCDASLLPLGILLRRIAGGRLTVTACGLDVVHQARWYVWLMGRVIRSADAYVAISSATADALISRGVPSDAIVVIPCGVSVPSSAILSKADGPPMLITVGRLIPRKGVAWFVLHALPLIRRRVPDVRYLVVGAGPDERRIRDAAHRACMENVVELKTRCDDKERDALLAGADVFVAPNIPVSGDMEGFGIACVEAAVRGTPVAAARLEGLADAVAGGETGLFFPPQDASSCADAVAALLLDPPSRGDVARAARMRFAWDVVFPLYRRHVFDA